MDSALHLTHTDRKGRSPTIPFHRGEVGWPANYPGPIACSLINDQERKKEREGAAVLTLCMRNLEASDLYGKPENVQVR